MYSFFWVFGAVQHRGLFYHKSMGMRDLLGNIEGGALPKPKGGGRTTMWGHPPSSLRARKGQDPVPSGTIRLRRV